MTAIEKEYKFLISRAVKEKNHVLAEELRQAYKHWRTQNPDLVS